MGSLKGRYVLLTAAYCGLIFYLSSQQDPDIPEIGIPGVDKVAHAILYAGLAATLSLGIRRSNDRPLPAIQFAVPIIFAILYGITDEVHQLFVPNRTFEILDLVADGFGAAALQVFLCSYLWKRSYGKDAAVL